MNEATIIQLNVSSHSPSVPPSSSASYPEFSGVRQGDVLAQWLKHWTGDPKVEGLNPVF